MILPHFNCLCICCYRTITNDSRDMLGRDPLLILETSAYHFCKFALVKKPKISLKDAEGHPKNCDEQDDGETRNVQHTDDSEGSVENSGLLQGMFYLACLEIFSILVSN